MTTARLPVTVAIPVRNEEAGLPACLERLSRFERVVVIDSASTDRTCECARAHGAEVLQFRWDGRFPKKRNWFLREHPPETPWVLFLDADELVDDGFCDELARVLPSTRHAGFWLTYDNWFLGRRLRHGTPNRKLALFRVGSGEYERIEETGWSRLDMEIHEHPVLEGTVGDIVARIEHRDDRGLAHWLERHRQYAAWEAERWSALSGTCPPHLSKRQAFKYRCLPARWFPWVAFVDSYLLRAGWLDGVTGLRHAWLKSRYFADIGRRIRRRRREER